MKVGEQHPALVESEMFSTLKLAELVDVPVHELDYWVNCDLLIPSIQKARGHGSRKLFSIDDVRCALLIRRLRQAGWKPKQIGKALITLTSVLKNPELFSHPILIHEGSALLILCRDKERELTLLDATSPGQYVMVIALETLEEETRRSIARSK